LRSAKGVPRLDRKIAVPGWRSGRLGQYRRCDANSSANIILSSAHANVSQHATAPAGQQSVGHAKSLDDLGQSLGCHLEEREVRDLDVMEWALTADEIVWPAAKLGMEDCPCRNAAIDDWIAAASCRRTSLLEAGGRT